MVHPIFSRSSTIYQPFFTMFPCCLTLSLAPETPGCPSSSPCLQAHDASGAHLSTTEADEGWDDGGICQHLRCLRGACGTPWDHGDADGGWAIYIYHISSNFICFFYIIETYRNYEYDKIRYVKNMRICDKTKLSTQFIMHVYIYIYIYISYIYIYIWTPKTSNLTMGKFGGKSPASGHMVRYHRTHHLWDSVATQGMGQIPVTSPS